MRRRHFIAGTRGSNSMPVRRGRAGALQFKTILWVSTEAQPDPFIASSARRCGIAAMWRDRTSRTRCNTHRATLRRFVRGSLPSSARLPT